MADFNQAIEWLKQGKKVRRNDWGNGDIFLETLAQNIMYRDGNVFVIDLNDIASDAWELFVSLGQGDGGSDE